MSSFDNLPSSDDYQRDDDRASRAAFRADGGVTGPRPPSDDTPDPHATRNKLICIVVVLIVVWLMFHGSGGLPGFSPDMTPCADCVRGS